MPSLNPLSSITNRKRFPCIFSGRLLNCVSISRFTFSLNVVPYTVLLQSSANLFLLVLLVSRYKRRRCCLGIFLALTTFVKPLDINADANIFAP